MIIDVQQAIVLVCNPGAEEETITRLARVGFDYVIGHLKGGIEAWKNEGKEIDIVERYSADQLQEHFNDEGIEIIDIRKQSEYENGHIENVKNIPLDNINNELAAFPQDKKIVLHCAGGYRSMIAASILKARGWQNIVDVEGGYGEIQKLDLPFSQNTEKI